MTFTARVWASDTVTNPQLSGLENEAAANALGVEAVRNIGAPLCSGRFDQATAVFGVLTVGAGAIWTGDLAALGSTLQVRAACMLRVSAWGATTSTNLTIDIRRISNGSGSASISLGTAATATMTPGGNPAAWAVTADTGWIDADEAINGHDLGYTWNRITVGFTAQIWMCSYIRSR